MFKLIIGGVLVATLFTCFILPQYYYYNVAIINMGFWLVGIVTGCLFYQEFLTTDIDDSDIEFMEDFKKIVDENSAYKIQILDNEKMRIVKLADNELTNYKMRGKLGVKS